MPMEPEPSESRARKKRFSSVCSREPMGGSEHKCLTEFNMLKLFFVFICPYQSIQIYPNIKSSLWKLVEVQKNVEALEKVGDIDGNSWKQKPPWSFRRNCVSMIVPMEKMGFPPIDGKKGWHLWRVIGLASVGIKDPDASSSPSNSSLFFRAWRTDTGHSARHTNKDAEKHRFCGTELTISGCLCIRSMGLPSKIYLFEQPTMTVCRLARHRNFKGTVEFAGVHLAVESHRSHWLRS